MKRILVFALTVFSAPSVNAETLWIGNAFVTTAVQPTCGSAAAVGDFDRVIYRPAGGSLGNGADSYFAYIGQRANFTMTVPGNTFTAGLNYAGQGVSSFINFSSKVGGITNWTMAPPTLDASVKHATLTATLANFFTVTGCTVSLRADLELVP